METNRRVCIRKTFFFPRILLIIAKYDIWKSIIFTYRETSSVCWTTMKSGGYINNIHLKKINSELYVKILTLFSIDFFTRLKLFQRESNSCLWDPWNCKRSPIICQRISNFVFTTHHVKPGHIKIMQILNDNCTFMIRNKDLVSSSELLSMWSKIGE